MTLLAAAAAGVVAGALSWLLVRGPIGAARFRRDNYRGARVPVGGGVVLVAGLVVVEAAWWALAGDGGDSSVHLAAVVLVVGFGLLGWIDDVHGHGHEKGFRGHLAALARGRLTTGGLKLVGGGVLALAAGALLHGDRGAVEVIIDGALIASAANLGNLFDRRPGRVIKVSLLAGAALVVAAGASPDLVPVAAVLGAAVALLPADLGERIMLGDTGSNVLGAVLGLGVVATAGPGVRSVVLVIVVLLNAASEIVSFSRVIEATPPLRALDRLGRSR